MSRANGQKSLRPPYPFDKKKLSPLSGSGTPTRSETPPSVPVPPPAAPPAQQNHQHHHQPPATKNGNGTASALSSESDDSDDDEDDLVLPDKPRKQPGHSPRGPRASATVVPVAKKKTTSVSEQSSSDSDSNSSSSSSSSDDSSEDEEEPARSQPKTAPPPTLHMPVIGGSYIIFPPQLKPYSARSAKSETISVLWLPSKIIHRL